MSESTAGRTVTSIGSPGRDLDAVLVHDHCVLRLRHHPAADLEEGLVRHHKPPAGQPAEMDRRLPIERVTPAPRERKGVEVRFDLLQELIRGDGGPLSHPDEPVDVPRLATLDLPPPPRRPPAPPCGGGGA